MKTKLQTVGISVFILVLLITGTGLLSRTGNARPALQSLEDQVRKVTVTGVGRVSVEPDQAVVLLGVQTQAETAAQALEQNNQSMQALIDALQEAGIDADDIQTQSVQLFPRYESPEPQGQDTPELVGYTASNIVEVTVGQIEAVGETLDAAVAAGGNTIQSIRFEVSNPAEALEQARTRAIENARAKAEQLAELVDAELGAVLTIDETTRTPVPVLEEAEAAQADRAQVPIQPGTETVEVEVQVSWMLE